MEVTRRQFIGSSAAAVIAAGTMATGKVFGANDRIGVAVVGFNGQGNSHINDLIKGLSNDVDIVALCDVDSGVLERGVASVKKATNKGPKAYDDVRKLLEDNNVDAVTTATPNHWHSLVSVWAAEAGKHVYVEKPATHDVWEGKQLIAAAKKNKVVIQHGTQQRSDATRMRDMKLMHDGFIGDIVLSRGVVYKNGNRGSIGRGKPGKPPANLNWDLWQGPAQAHDYMLKADGKGGLQVHYNWHWFWEYGNGEIGNQGVHEMDIAVWAMNKGLPVKVYSSGGRFGLDDDGQTPNTQATTFTYADGTMLEFEVRNLGSFTEGDDDDCTNSAFGTKGYWVKSKGFFDYKKNPIPVPADGPKFESGGKWQNWVKAIRSGKPEDNVASPEVSHTSCAHIHLGNIAFRLGRSLQFDPKAEKFVGEDEANGMLKRQYREPFVVPELA